MQEGAVPMEQDLNNFIGLASCAERRESAADQNRNKLKIQNSGRLKRYEPIKNCGQLALSRNQFLEHEALLATAKFCNALVPCQENVPEDISSTEPLYLAMTVIYTNVELSKCSGG